MPHPVAGQENCLTCHATDSTVKPAPTDHAGRTNDLCQACHKPAADGEVTPATTPAGTPEVVSADVCLGCHGPFEKLSEAEPTFTNDAGETVNPHTYVPHDSDKITLCTNCHKPHPVPLPTGTVVDKPDVRWCYSACHHETNFTPCVACH